jgi:hypothetical protein
MKRGSVYLYLRPIAVFMIFLFVVVPLMLFNGIILENRLRYSEKANLNVKEDPFLQKDRMDHLFVDLKSKKHNNSFTGSHKLSKCMNVSSDMFLSFQATQELKEQCIIQEEQEVPDLVHFIHVPLHLVPLHEGEIAPEIEDFTFLHYAATQSIRRFLKSERMVLHYVDEEPRGYWYTQCQRHLSVHKVLLPTLPKNLPLSIEKRRELLEFLILLRVLRKQGGIAFADFHTYTLRSFENFKLFPAVIGRQSPPSINESFLITTRTMVSVKASQFIVQIEEQMEKLLLSNVDVWHVKSLEHIVGDLALDLINKNQSKGFSCFIAGDGDLFGSLNEENTEHFITALVGDDTINLNQVFAYHLPRPAVDKKKIIVHSIYDQVTNVETLSRTKTLFGALVRHILGVNTSAEVDKHGVYYY